MKVDNFRPELGSDVISGMIVTPVGMKVGVKLCNSKSNRSRDIRLPHYLPNDNDDESDDDAGVRRSSHKGKTA